MSKNAFIFSCFDHYAERMHLWDSRLKALGYETVYITSDFDHRTKAPFTCSIPGSVQLHVRPYYRNLSVDRILSHWCFARKAKQFLDKNTPDVIVALLPPNFLGSYLAAYKKKHPKVKLIFDIFDLWPETFPSGKAKKLLAPAFRVWAWLRDRALPKADYVTTECELFRQKLTLPARNSRSVYLCAQPLSEDSAAPALSEDRLELCYLGSINNVISIPDICQLISRLVRHRPVTVHIIGSGEQQQTFIDEATAAGAEVNFYGPIFDEQRKRQIMDRCHFGLNIMKSSVCVGLTMKSVDYFRYGLPIINNIPSDTQSLIYRYQSGFSLDSDAGFLAALTPQDHLQLRENVHRMFLDHFHQQQIEEKITGILNSVL